MNGHWRGDSATIERDDTRHSCKVVVIMNAIDMYFNELTHGMINMIGITRIGIPMQHAD